MQSYLQVRRTVVTRVQEAVKAIALCHNVTPVADNGDTTATRVESASEDMEMNIFSGPDQQAAPSTRKKSSMTYQASSPDEVRQNDDDYR